MTIHSRATRMFMLLALPTLFTPAALAADNWPRWRGPADNGSTEAGSYPVKWDATTNVLWKTALPGKGCSTPMVWDRRIYVTTPADGQDALVALDWEGKQLWQARLGAERHGKNRNGSGSNPSPTTDGKTLFVYFKSGTLAALDMSGKVLWKTNLQRRFSRDTLFWDIGTSPVLTEKDVVVAVMHHGGSYIAAFDKLTGKIHWKVARDYETPVEGDHSYATPIVFREGGREELLVWGGEHLTAHAADDGRTLWSCGGFNPAKKHNWVVVGSPVIVGNIAVLPYARGGELHGIRLGGTGDVTATNRAWELNDASSFVPTPAVSKGKVYVLRDKGEVNCIDPVSGKIEWTGAFPKSSASFYASPVIAGGRLYAAREDGVVFVASIDGALSVLSENAMGKHIIASPVPVGDRLFLRGEQDLFCIGTK